MAAIVVAKVRVTDPEKYETYKPLAKLAIEAFGGRYLVRGAEPVAIEGEAGPVRYVVVEFDSVETVQRFYDSPEYRKARDARAGAAIAEITALQGI
ncbi:DUF1330 domain-containing protein [Ferrovibrio sp.]|uniref:DUF1330 domain-containing protein n=1 Tax=Ferrovibrio sp. TaxID=1917215 RepID=UPI001B47199C|nr:DUF1330 domain-containing protein [Ferrovibrio sp.]MBP7065471.1 DUF1330 domain-containing protein [Ferrovibrio sp.]